MLNEQEWKDRIREAIRSSGGASKAGLADVEAAISEHPSSASLWTLRGDVIQLLDDTIEGYELPEALRSYQRAVELDPQEPRAQESIGHYLDAVEDRPAEAEPWFRRAIACGAGQSAWGGLARVIAQLGRRAEAVQLLESCPHVPDPDLKTVHEEIARGEWDPIDE